MCEPFPFAYAMELHFDLKLKRMKKKRVSSFAPVHPNQKVTHTIQNYPAYLFEFTFENEINLFFERHSKKRRENTTQNTSTLDMHVGNVSI